MVRFHPDRLGFLLHNRISGEFMLPHIRWLVVLCGLATAGILRGELHYRIVDFCFPDSCFAYGINNDGAVIGTRVSGFVYYPGRGFIDLSPDGIYRAAEYINNKGVAVGVSLNGAFAYLPESSEYLDLSSFGQVALFINDHGDIQGDPPRPEQQPVPGVNLSFIFAITDDGTVIGAVERPPGTGLFTVVYTPGQQPTFLPYSVGRTNAGYFNRHAQVVFNGPNSLPSSNGVFLYTPGSGTVKLPVPDSLRAFGISDSGLIYLVDFQSNEHYLFDSSGTFGIGSGPVLLESLLPANSDWTLGIALSAAFSSVVNDEGIVLVGAQSSTRGFTFVELVPDTASQGGSASPAPLAHPKRGRTPRPGVCGAFRFNSVAVCESK
jgi:hypothetical protein